ncbi:hypothetical protein ABZZ47_36655 [Streptomyces sp. NPDC006465]|uniref:hypothetical protein n=1 Tax=Streptomyces sp. NPDC006465 TaxID=3157174 RepID=UPI00339EAC1B
MQRAHDQEPAQGGLSTEDLAQPHGRNTEDEAAESSATPTFPGESTAVASERGEPQDEDARESEPRAQDEAPQLLTAEDEEAFRARWHEIQNKFVDDPRNSVHSADALVADVMRTLAETFSERKQELEGQWNRGEQVNTEELRRALRQYRTFFNRLLTT